MKHRKTEQNRQDVDEDEDEECGVRKTCRSWTQGCRATKREKNTKRPTCRVAVGPDSA